MKRLFSWILSSTLLLSIAPIPAAVLDLRPVADTALFENMPNNNLGSMNFMPVGTISDVTKQNRGLLQFNVTGSVPSGAQVSAVTLRVHVSRAGSVSSPTFDLHRMLVSWTEGNNTGGPTPGTGNLGSPADAGESSWNNRAAPSTPWSTPGGLVGTDFATTASASHAVAATGSSTFTSTPGLVSDVQAWLDNPSGNFGWLLKVQNEAVAATARRIDSREASAANAPLLTITYSLPPQITDVSQGGGEFRFKFVASMGVPYQVQRNEQPNPLTWVTFTNVQPQNMDVTVSIADAIGEANSFYRVVAP